MLKKKKKGGEIEKKKETTIKNSLRIIFLDFLFFKKYFSFLFKEN